MHLGLVLGFKAQDEFSKRVAIEAELPYFSNYFEWYRSLVELDTAAGLEGCWFVACIKGGLHWFFCCREWKLASIWFEKCTEVALFDSEWVQNKTGKTNIFTGSGWLFLYHITVWWKKIYFMGNAQICWKYWLTSSARQISSCMLHSMLLLLWVTAVTSWWLHDEKFKFFSDNI